MNDLKLRGMTWDHPRGYLGLEAATKIYKSETGIDISWDRRSLQAFADASISDMARDYDFIILDHPHVGLIAETECLLPLCRPDDIKNISLGGSLESYIWKDELWALPIDAACQMAVKRPDLCKAEIPNWEAVFDVTAKDYKLVTPLLPVDAFDMMMTLVAGRDEVLLPFSEQEFVSEENGVLALKVLKALYKLGPAEATEWNPIKILELMSSENEFAYSPCLFGYINYARPKFKEHKLEFVDLPSFLGSSSKHGILGGAGIGVSAKSNHIHESVKFAHWVTSEAVQSGVYLENEGQPAHLQSWRKMGANPSYRGFLHGGLATMEAAWTRPRDIWFLGFVDDVCDIFTNFFLQDQSEEAFLKTLNMLYRHHHNSKGVVQ